MTQIITKKIVTQVGDVQVPGLFCLPAGEGPFPMMIVLHGSDGFKPNHQAIAEKLAGEGMAAYAPTWFGGDPARPHWDSLRKDDIPAGITDFIRQAPVDPDRTGVIGFSRGGGLALIVASWLDDVKAVVNYFGLTAWEGGLKELPHLELNQHDPLDFLRHLSCPILSFHGDVDDVVPVDNTYRLVDACERYNINHQYIIYPGINHSFIWEGGDKYDQHAHHDSWARAMDFLQHNLSLR